MFDKFQHNIANILEVTMINVIAIICAGAWIVFLLVLLFSCKTKAGNYYEEYLEYVNKKEYSFKDMLPAGFYFNDSRILYKFMPNNLLAMLNKYNMKVNAKITEIYGAEYSEFYVQLHNANKFVVSVVLAVIFGLLSFVMGATADSSNAFIFLIISIVCLACMPLLLDKNLDKKIDERRTKIKLEFPEFVNKLTLLVNAGMTISTAWEKVVEDNKKEGPLYEELKRSAAEINAGKPEAVAYEDFGKRCKVKEIVKFVSVIVLNLKKGGSEVVPTLKIQGDECWEMRKAEAKRLGEEASSKIMLPLMMMFIGVILIVATPAMLSFSQGF